jgi:uracil-DNA glycosylase family 4
MEKAEEFSTLVCLAAACVICERMRDRQAVLSHLNGSLDPKILFLAEAPGRNGADRTRIPFHGDKSGDTFETLLASIQLTRNEVFITNSVLCSPRKASGANDKPARTEIKNCSGYLRRVMELLNPPVIATLGAVALEALQQIEPHAFKLREHVATAVAWNGRKLVPLYHPSPQVLISVRSLTQQLRDYQMLLQVLSSAGGNVVDL